MASRTASLLSSRKAQFFILSAFAIVSVLYFVSRWIEPYTIIDTSAVALREEPFVFNNIREKAVELVETTKNCDELAYNLDEYKNFVKDFASMKNLDLTFNYTIDAPCSDSVLRTTFYMKLVSSTMRLESSFVATK